MERDEQIKEAESSESGDELVFSNVQVSWEGTFDWDKEYTNEYFNSLYIDVYDSDGEPYMDYYEYVDACINNSEVDRVRKEYFRRKAEKEQAQSKEGFVCETKRIETE